MAKDYEGKIKKYKELVSEISSLKEDIQRYNNKDVILLGSFNYRDAVHKLIVLRRKQVRFDKEIKSFYEREIL